MAGVPTPREACQHLCEQMDDVIDEPNEAYVTD